MVNSRGLGVDAAFSGLDRNRAGTNGRFMADWYRPRHRNASHHNRSLFPITKPHFPGDDRQLAGHIFGDPQRHHFASVRLDSYAFTGASLAGRKLSHADARQFISGLLASSSPLALGHALNQVRYSKTQCLTIQSFLVV